MVGEGDGPRWAHDGVVSVEESSTLNNRAGDPPTASAFRQGLHSRPTSSPTFDAQEAVLDDALILLKPGKGQLAAGPASACWEKVAESGKAAA